MRDKVRLIHYLNYKIKKEAQKLESVLVCELHINTGRIKDCSKSHDYN